MADARRQIIHPGVNINRQTLGNANFAIDTNAKKVAWVFPAENTDAITRGIFRYGARTGTPPIHKISIQGVSTTTGEPDGTVKGGGSPASKTFTPPADATWDGTKRDIAFDNAYTPSARGEALALVVEYSSGTVDASNNSSFTTTDGNGFSAGNDGLPYSITNTAGTWTKGASHPLFAYGSATMTYGQPMVNASNLAVITSTTTPDEVAARFIVPGSGTYQISDVWVFLTTPVAGKSMKVILYSGTTVLQTVTWDMDIIQAFGAARFHHFWFPEVPLATLRAGIEYRIGFQPQDAVGNYTFSKWTQDVNADWAAYPLGIEWYLSTRTDAGAWTDDPTSRLECILGLADVTSPSPGVIVAS